MWVGNRSGTNTMTFEEFEGIARKIDYDPSWGCEYIPRNLVVVGPDWWLERHEYDGSEWWEFKRVPVARVDAAKYDLAGAFNEQNDWRDDFTPLPVEEDSAQP